MLAPAGGVVGGVIGGTLSVLGSVAAALVVVVLAVYLLNDFDRITAASASCSRGAGGPSSPAMPRTSMAC